MNMFEKAGADFTAAQKGNMEAFGKSAEIWKDGFQEFAKSFATSAQGHIDRSKTAFESMKGAKSLSDVIEVQKNLIMSGVDTIRADSTKMASDCVQRTKDVMAPLTAQFTRAVDSSKGE